MAVTLLVHVVCYPRHRPRDMVLAYLGLNVGVLAVTTVLIGSPVGVGSGMGLFAVLVMAVVDRGPLLATARHQTMTLDAVLTDETALKACPAAIDLM